MNSFKPREESQIEVGTLARQGLFGCKLVFSGEHFPEDGVQIGAWQAKESPDWIEDMEASIMYIRQEFEKWKIRPYEDEND